MNLKHSLSSFLWFFTQDGEGLAANTGICSGLGREKAEGGVVAALGIREGMSERRQR